MRILIYCAHPAQYHFFKNIIKKLVEKGHVIKLLIKTKDILETLVNEDGCEYENILARGNKNGFFPLLLALIKRDLKIFSIARKFKPDILIGSDASVTQVGWFMRKPRLIVGEDDYRIVKKLHWLMMPFANAVLTPVGCQLGPFEGKKIAFDGYMKSSYLHPNIFRPDKKIIEEADLKTPYCLIRMVKLGSHHDNNKNGLSKEVVGKLVNFLKESGYNVYIDSETELHPELAVHKLTIKKTSFHDVLAFSSLVISDSQSLSVEAALLGIPSIRFNDFAGKISVLEELEHKYHLTFGIPSKDPNKLFVKVQELLKNPRTNESFCLKKEKMLLEKINTTDFFVWFLDSFPDSLIKTRNRIADIEFMANIAV